MTEQEIRKLSRSELVQLVLDMEQTTDQQRQRIISMERQQRERAANLKKFGSIAESALQVSGVFEAAQQAANMYVEQALQMREAAELMKQEAEKILKEAQDECRRLEEETQRSCQEQKVKAEEEASQYWRSLEQDLLQRLEDYVPAWHTAAPEPAAQEEPAQEQAEPEETAQDAQPDEAMEAEPETAAEEEIPLLGMPELQLDAQLPEEPEDTGAWELLPMEEEPSAEETEEADASEEAEASEEAADEPEPEEPAEAQEQPAEDEQEEPSEE